MRLVSWPHRMPTRNAPRGDTDARSFYARCLISESGLKTFSVPRWRPAQGATQYPAAKYHKVTGHLFQVFEASQEDGVAVKNGRVEMVGFLGSIDVGPKNHPNISKPATKYGKG